MKKLLAGTLFFLAAFGVKAQDNYESVLLEIEKNNTALAALREQINAEKIGNRTGLTPENPELGFGYTWANPDNTAEISLTQTFDFPTAYSHRRKIADLKNENAELPYKSERINILLSAKQICIELIFYNILLKEYAVRLQNAEIIAAVYKTELEKAQRIFWSTTKRN
jgi:hypothetical protein